MLVYLLYGLFFISCLVMVVAVLLQPGKTDAGALFTSNISSTAFGPRGTTTILAKITIGAAVVFFVSALLLAMPAITGNISVLQTVGDTTETTAPATNTDANDAANTETNVNANTASNTNAETNTASANTATESNAATDANKTDANANK
jgi:protein translocase, SecG subunit